MARGRNREQPTSSMGRVDALFFAFSALSATWLAYLLVRDGIRPGWPWLLLIVFWAFFSYLLLPRLHRILTRLYIPEYFIGRARTSDGLLGDPVNLALLGSEDQLHHALRAGGWVRADDIDFISTRRIIASTLRRRSYPQAPVSPLLLFDRPQDFAYQQEVAGSPTQRHHVRFWRCPDGWMLPGGIDAEWLAAATFDRTVGLSLFTLQVTHKIEENTDIERDFVRDTVSQGDPAVRVEVIRHFSTGYHSRNGGGDRIETDGDLPILDLRQVTAPGTADSETTDSRDRRPAQTLFGAGVTLLRAVTYLLAATVVGAPLDFSRALAAELILILDAKGDLPVKAVAGVLVMAAIVDIVLARSVLAGRNWARLWLMSVCVLSTTIAFVADARGTGTVTLAHLPIVGSSILVLLALSSHRARDFATRQRD